MIDLLAARLLRAHIGERAQHRAGPGELRLGGGHLGDPEVEDPHALAGGHDDIGGLDVAVHHSGGVSGGARPAAIWTA